MPSVTIRVIIDKRITGRFRASVRVGKQKGLLALKKPLIESVREKMKKDTGAMRRNVSGRVETSSLIIYGNLEQTSIDEYGRKKGTSVTVTKTLKSKTGKSYKRKYSFYTNMPPSGPGSHLYKWVGRKGFAKNGISQSSLSFIIARSIAKKGIKPNKPFERTGNELVPLATRILENAINYELSKL